MRDRAPIELAAGLVGLAFLSVGIAGFIPGITTELYDELDFAGHEGEAELLGIFQVSVLHNLVHILFGVVGLAFASTAARARTFLLVGGAVYLALWVYGLVIDLNADANFVPVNTADNWLHFGLGAAMLLLGLTLGRATRPAAGGAGPTDARA